MFYKIPAEQCYVYFKFTIKSTNIKVIKLHEKYRKLLKILTNSKKYHKVFSQYEYRKPGV